MRKAIFRLASGIFLVLALYALAAVIGAVIPVGSSHANDPKTVDLHLVKGPIHYDFLIPLTPEVRGRLEILTDAGVALNQPQARWLLIGWGAREFYTTTGTYADVSFGAVFRGLTGDSSVLRTDVVGPLSQDLEFPAISMTQAQFDRFLTAIEASFARTEDGVPIPIDTPGFSPTDRFFAAKGRFNVFQTCNVWIGEMLREAGVRFGIWVPLPFSVTLSYRLFQSSPH